MATKEVGAAFKDLIAALAGISTFSPTTPGDPAAGPLLTDEQTQRARQWLGGQLEPIPYVRLRWYPPDIERAQRAASNGDLTLVGQLCESMKIDGVIRGLHDARTSVVNFPKRYYGNAEIIQTLRSKTNSDRDIYNEMIPSTEASLIVGDGINAGVGVGEMVPVVGRDFPVLIRRYPQNLYYLWTKNQWYYRSIVGLIPINPGIPSEEGNSWVLHIPGGRLSPWNSGLWNTVGRSYINKTQALFARQSYLMKHSHPARVAIAPLGANEEERKGLIQGVIRWALNAAFMLPIGWDLKLIESNGRGIEVYQKEIDTYNSEIATAYCGSAVMLQGTAGFSNMDVFRVVQKDLIKGTAEGWDHTVNTQIFPPFIGRRWGVGELENATTIETDIAEPKDKKAEADTMKSLGEAISGLVAAINSAQIAASDASSPVTLNAKEILAGFGLPTIPGKIIEMGRNSEGSPSQTATTDPPLDAGLGEGDRTAAPPEEEEEEEEAPLQ
jgi:hypothetical protein